jgi:hypothetical protein
MTRWIESASGPFGSIAERGRHRNWGRLGIGCMLLILLLACSRRRESARGAVGSEPNASVPVQVTDPVANLFEAIVTGCSIDTEHALVSRCKNDDKAELIRRINGGSIARADVLPALVTALESNDKQRQTVAAKVLEGAFRTNVGRLGPDQVSPELASRLLQAVLKLDTKQAVQAVPAAVHVSMIRRQSEALFTALDAHPEVGVKAAAYVHLLRYGGKEFLPKIEQLISTGEPQVAAAAVDSLRRLPNQSEADGKRICELARGLAQDARRAVQAKAMGVLATCKGAYLDAALTALEGDWKANALSGASLRGLEQACLVRRGEAYGSEAQCARLRSLLERVALDKKQDVEVRSLALLSLGVQFPDAKTRTFCKKFSHDPEPRLVTAAERVTQSIDALTKSVDAEPSVSAGRPAASVPAPELHP